MTSKFCETAEYTQMFSKISYIVNKCNLPARIDCYCNSIAIMFSPDVKLNTGLIVLFADISEGYKCNFIVSNYCNCLTFMFSSLV